MTATKEQLAFNAFWNSLDEHEGMDAEVSENVFKDGYNAGHKAALEDVAEGFIKQKSWLRDYAYAVVEHAAEEGAFK